MKALVDYVGNFWYALFHSDLMWPIHSRYVCRQWLRQFLVSMGAPTPPFLNLRSSRARAR